MARSSGFAISIRATDEVTSQVEKINKAIFGLGRTAKRVSDDTGPLHRISVNARATGIVVRELGEHGVKALERFGRSAEEVGAKIGAFAPGLGGLTSAATLAGFGELSRRSAEFGANIVRTSARVGISKTELQGWTTAMRGAGLSATDTAGMLQGVNKASLEARAFGGPALGVANQFGIDLKGDTTKTILSVADAVKKLHDAGGNPETEGQILDYFGIPREALEQLEKGGPALKKLLDARREAGALNDTDIGRLAELDKTYKGVEDAASNFGSKIVADVSGPLMGAAHQAEQILDDLRKMPAGMQAVETASTALAGVLGAGLTLQLGKLLFKLSGVSTVLSGLFSMPGILTAIGAGAGYGAYKQDETLQKNWGRKDYTIDPWSMTPQLGNEPQENASPTMGGVSSAQGILQRIGRALGIHAAAAAPMGGFAAGTDEQMARAAIAAAGGNAKAQAGLLANMYAESGLRRDRPGPGGDFGWAQWVGSRKTALFAMAKANNLDPYSAQAQAMYLQHELTTNPQYAAMIRRMNNAPDATTAAKISGFTFEQGGGAAGLFGGGNFSQAGLDAFHSKGAESIYRRLTTADAPGVAAASMGLPSLPSSYVFGVHPHAGKHWVTDQNSGIRQLVDNPVPPDPKSPWLQPGYVLPPLTGGAAPPVYLRGQEPGMRGGADASESDAADTKHEVTIHIPNAPPGTRSSITAADGPAKVNLRTSYSMGETW